MAVAKDSQKELRMKRMVLSLGLLALGAMPGYCQTGAYEYAQQMNRSGAFRHDPGFRGAEVIYRSSGMATPEAARAAWLQSRAGHRELLLSGAITDIQCVGNVCVGRGGGSVAPASYTMSTGNAEGSQVAVSNAAPTTTSRTYSTRRRWFRR
ncbi:MAG: hypothetical protein ACK43N_02005 [Pirellulaceae bacterium]|jgi:hypothetical protein